MKFQKSQNLIAVVFPRDEIDLIISRFPELEFSGVHLLRGLSNTGDFDYDCFIGDSNNNKERLEQRENEKANLTVARNAKFFNEVWDTTMVVASLSNELGDFGAEYIRKDLVKLVRSSKWNSVRITNIIRHIKDSKNFDLERLDKLTLETKKLVGNLGWNIFNVD